MKVPFFDIKRVNEPIMEEAMKKLREVAKNGTFILGPEVASFEMKFANYVGTKFACGVDNGTSALELIMRALDIGEGDEVITTPASFIASSSAIAFCGAKPVFVDIDNKTYNINVDRIKEKITSKTKAILPVHLYGQVADMSNINSIAKENDLFVIEDACEAHGANYNGKKVGNLSIAGAFSFYPSKNLGCWGDGGMIVSSSENLIDKVMQLRNYGQRQKYHHETLAFNKRLDSIHAAILNLKLPILERQNEERRGTAKLYDSLLERSHIITPSALNDHVYYVYVIQSQKRNGLAKFLKEDGIETGIHFPIPIHLQKCFSYLGYSKGDFPEAEKLSERCLSLPMFPGITEEEIKYVADKTLEFEMQFC